MEGFHFFLFQDPQFCPDGNVPISDDTNAAESFITIGQIAKVGTFLTTLDPDPCREFRGESIIDTDRQRLQRRSRRGASSLLNSILHHD